MFGLARINVLNIVVLLSASCFLLGCMSTHNTFSKGQLTATRLTQSLQLDGDIDPVWMNAKPLVFSSDWRGQPTATSTRVRALWSTDALYLLWELEGAGLRNTDHAYPLDQQRNKLYDEDCVELFIAPHPLIPNQYAEIEVGPYGHYLDLWIDRKTNRYDETWSSGVKVAARQDVFGKRAQIEMVITAPALKAALTAGARLPIGLYRIEGAQPRQFLAAFPTLTSSPNFHVPEAFGTLVLIP
jgi:hypothetical protein